MNVDDVRMAVIAKLQPRVVAIELLLTDRCNLCCAYCFERSRDSGREMVQETAHAAVDFALLACRDADVLYFTLIGGEPMLKFDLIRDTIAYATEQATRARKRVFFDMTTNGVLLTEDHVRFFRDVGLRYCLSLDGKAEDNDVHRRVRRRDDQDQYDAVAAKMRVLKRYQHWQGARVTVMPDTAARLAGNIAHLHHELAINQFIIAFASGIAWTDAQIADYRRGLMETFELLLEERVANGNRRLRIGLFEVGQLSAAYLEHGTCGWGCGAGSGRVAVAPDGTLHGCTKLAFASKVRERDLSLGTVELGFRCPENRMTLLNHTATPRPKCMGCSLAGRCNGGCYATNLSDTGSVFEPADYYCKLVYVQVQAADYARLRLRQLGLDNLFWNTTVAGQPAGANRFGVHGP